MVNPVKLSGEEENSEIKKFKGKLDFIHKRFAKLIDLMNANLDKEIRINILESLGMACASEYSQFYANYKNNLKGFLEDIHKIGIEQVIHDEDKKILTLIGKKTGGCFCPFVKQSVTPADFCTCSQGWQKKVFETITGKPVTAEVKGSVLLGNDRCSFVIKLT